MQTLPPHSDTRCRLIVLQIMVLLQVTGRALAYAEPLLREVLRLDSGPDPKRTWSNASMEALTVVRLRLERRFADELRRERCAHPVPDRIELRKE